MVAHGQEGSDADSTHAGAQARTLAREPSQPRFRHGGETRHPQNPDFTVVLGHWDSLVFRTCLAREALSLLPSTGIERRKEGREGGARRRKGLFCCWKVLQACPPWICTP